MSVFRKQTSRKGNIVYEEILQKNFQIIETFLKKFHQIFMKQDQFEQQITKFTERFGQFDELFDEFKQEQKLSIVMLEKKVNNMKSSARQSHRVSHRFSKINLPIFEAIQASQASKNYTLLKFDSIDSQSQESIDVKSVLKKQSEQPSFSLKQYEAVKESIESARQEITQMKDKISFLSAYTSSLSNQEKSKSKHDSLKKQIAESLQNDIKSMIEKQIQTQMIETQRVFLQQIKNLALQFSDQITLSIDKKYEQIHSELKILRQKAFTNQQAEKLNEQIKKNMEKFATQCMQIFPNKEDTKKSINFLERKIKILENSHKQLAIKADEDREHAETFKNVFNVSSVNNTNENKQISLHKQTKSLSQMIKHKNQSFSMVFGERSKENTSRGTYRKGYELSQGVLFTSKVSTEFMKNFGKNQKKLIKGNFCTKKQANQNEKVQGEENLLRPHTALRQSMESF